MVKVLSFAAMVFAFAVFGFSGASAAPQNRSVMPDGSYKVADWDDRVCCKRGGADFWTTRRRCDSVGGHEVRRGECRNDQWNERWDQRWWDFSGDWSRRVCC